MSRKFVPITRNQLRAKIETDGDEYITNLTPIIEKDLKKVTFSNENISDESYRFGPKSLIGYNKLPNGMEYYGVCAGGDWETPVFFCIYWDGKNLRAYIPEDGNLWNRTTKEAYGNDDEADLKYARKLYPDDENLKDDNFDIGGYFDNWDCEAIKKDIMKRISSVKPKTNSNTLASYTNKQLLDELRKRLEDHEI